MKLRMIILIMFLALIAHPLLPQQPSEPLTKAQVMDLVKFGMDSTALAKKITDFGIDFEPTDDYLEALRTAGAQDPVIQAIRKLRPKPLSREQVGKLVAGGVASERATTLVKQRGIDFEADEDYLKALRVAGGDETLIGAVRDASAARAAVKGDLLISTFHNAKVYLDGELQGTANGDGLLSVKAWPGTHALRVALAGKKDFQRSVSLTTGQTVRVDATLVDIPTPSEAELANLPREEIPEDWINVQDESPATVRLVADHLYLKGTLPGDGNYISGMGFTCDTKRSGDTWTGKCHFTLTFFYSEGSSLAWCPLDLDGKVTSLSPHRIQGEFQGIDTPRRRQYCPTPSSTERMHFGLIPRDQR